MDEKFDLFGEDGEKLSDADFGKKIREFRYRISTTSETTSLKNSGGSKTEIGPQSIRTVVQFKDYNREVYCFVKNPVLVLTQSVRDGEPQLGGSYDLYFTQECASRWNSEVASWDWSFSVKLWNSEDQRPENLLISTDCGSWRHMCGKRDIHASGQWVDRRIEGQSILSWKSGSLTWTKLTSVLGC